MGASDTPKHASERDEPALRNDLTAFKRDLLFVISRSGGVPDAPDHECPHGLAVMSTLEDAYGLNGNTKEGKSLHHRRLYPNLDGLVEVGLLEKDQRDRRTKFYRLTDDGVDLIEQQATWEADSLERTQP